MTTDDSLSEIAESAGATPAIAGFWRRFSACAVDVLLLGAVGQALAWTTSSLWFQLGPYGRFVGIVVVLLYFGVLNSRIGNGQTLGKRLMKIAVRDRQNQPIEMGRSVARIAILAAPALLNGWALPLFQSVASQWCLGVIVFGVGGTIAYMLVFNRRARQGLHDLVCGTYVVRLQGALVAGFPSTPRFHLVVSSVLVGVLVVGGIVAAYFATTGSLVRLHAIREALRQDTRFFSVGVQDFTFHATGRKTVRSLQIQVWFRGVPSSVERSQVTTELAREVLRVAGSVNEYDLLVVSLSSAYDLGIASGSMQYVDSQPPAVWRQRTSESAR